MSKVKFEEDVAPAFISSAIKVSVDLKRSNLEPVDLKKSNLDTQLAKAAVPPRTVAETSKITSSRHQDLLAIVTGIQPIRKTKRGDALDVTVTDASEDSTGVYAEVLVTVWGNTKQKMVAVGKPLVFFNLACKLDREDKQFNHWEDSVLCEAPECDMRIELTREFGKIKDATNSVMLTKFTPKTSMDSLAHRPLQQARFLITRHRIQMQKCPM